MPITDEALLQMMFKQHEGQPVEFIMAEYGKAKRLYLEIEQGISQGAPCLASSEAEHGQAPRELPAAEAKTAEPKKRFTKRSLKCDPKKAIGDDFIACCLCEKKFKLLSALHLKSHGISVDDYKKLCGYSSNQSLMSKQYAKNAEKRGKELAKARAEMLASAKKHS